MKLELNIDPQIKETLIKVYAQSMNKDVELIQSILSNVPVNKIIGFKEDDIAMLKLEEIIMFFTREKKVYAKTLKDEYLIKPRMYELEEKLRLRSFIRISQGEIINLEYVKKLDLSFKGTIAVELKNGDVSCVARRSIKEFKRALGI